MSGQTPEQRITAIAEVVGQHVWDEHNGSCGCRQDQETFSYNSDTYAAHVAAEIVNADTAARRIETVKALRAIPRNPMVSDGPLIKARTGEICEGNDDGTWYDYDRGKSVECEYIPLPAVLLWEPDHV